MSDDPKSIKAWQQQVSDDIVTRLRAVKHSDRSVELINSEAADEIERLRKALLVEENVYDILRLENEHLSEERDDARRMVCRHNYIRGGINPLQYAQMMGWDCYNKTPNDTKDYASRGR